MSISAHQELFFEINEDPILDSFSLADLDIISVSKLTLVLISPTPKILNFVTFFLTILIDFKKSKLILFLLEIIFLSISACIFDKFNIRS